MKLAAWKKYWSYIREIPVEHAASEYNPELNVSIKDGRFLLSTRNAIYSFADKYDNFVRAFKALDWQRFQADDVLVLGAGLASIPIILEKQIRGDFHFTLVDIDEVVLDLANRYALPDLHSSVDCVCADADAFVSTTGQRFDLICIDLFVDDVIPENFRTIGFLERIRALVQGNGLVLFNCLGSTRADRDKAQRFLDDVFRVVFPDAHALRTRSNYMLFSERRFMQSGSSA